MGAIARSTADVSVAVTGIAGPGGGSSQKPVGMVAFAWARKDGFVASATRYFAGGRAEVRNQSVDQALAGLLERIPVGPLGSQASET